MEHYIMIKMVDIKTINKIYTTTYKSNGTIYKSNGMVSFLKHCASSGINRSFFMSQTGDPVIVAIMGMCVLLSAVHRIFQKHYPLNTYSNAGTTCYSYSCLLSSKSCVLSMWTSRKFRKIRRCYCETITIVVLLPCAPLICISENQLSY